MGELATSAGRVVGQGQGLAVVVTVAVMLKKVVVRTVVVADWRRRQSAVWVDVCSQARTGGPSSTGWQGVPVERKIVVINVVRLQVVTGPIDKWVWVR